MGADALNPWEVVRRRFVAVNGEHPMTPADDAYACEHFDPGDDDRVRLAIEGVLPLPAYLLSDGTPMFADISTCVTAAGGVEQLQDWFVAFWPDDPATARQEWEAFLSGQYSCLRELDPVAIKRKSAAIAQARTAADRLRVDRHDEVAQGALAEAVYGGVGITGLDQLLLPMTAYDRLRFGGPTVRETWVDAVRTEFHTLSPPALPMHTERLTLRLATMDDVAPEVAAMADPDFVRHLLVDPQNPAEVAFRRFQRSQPQAPGEHDYLSLAMEEDGVVVGSVILMFHDSGRTQAEIGWLVYPTATGRGLATEAARELLRLAFEHYGVRRVVANLDALNERSAALARRLGMRQESHRLGDFWSKGRWTDSFDFAILRSEWQAD